MLLLLVLLLSLSFVDVICFVFSLSVVVLNTLFDCDCLPYAHGECGGFGFWMSWWIYF